MNLDDVFAQTARQQPDHPAVLGPGPDDRLSYRELDEAIGTAADRLRRAGVRPGACVGVHLPSGAGYVIATYAVWRCSGCAVPIPVELVADEKGQVCRDIALGFVISGRRGASFLGPLRGGEAADLAPGTAVVPVTRLRDHPPDFPALN